MAGWVSGTKKFPFEYCELYFMFFLILWQDTQQSHFRTYGLFWFTNYLKFSPLSQGKGDTVAAVRNQEMNAGGQLTLSYVVSISIAFMCSSPADGQWCTSVRMNLLNSVNITSKVPHTHTQMLSTS